MCSGGELGEQAGQLPGSEPPALGGSGSPVSGNLGLPPRRHRGQWQQVSGRPPRPFPTFSLKHSRSCCKNQAGDPSARALGSFASGARFLQASGHLVAISLPRASPAPLPAQKFELAEIWE